MAVLQNPVHLLSQIRKKFPEAEKEDWILRLDDKKKPKRSCVVCVARRPSESEGPSDDSKSSLISFTLNSSHRIIDARFRDSQLDINASDVVGRCIDELCCKDDKSVLDTLLDSVAECSAELRLSVKEYIISTRAHTLKTNNSDEPLVLECAVIRCVKQCMQKPCTVNSYDRLKASSSNESLDRYAQSYADERRQSTSSETPQTTFGVSQCPDAISSSNAVESSTVKFETISPPSSTPTEVKCSETTTSSDALSQLCTTIFSEADSLGAYTPQSAPPLLTQPPSFQFYSDQMFYVPCSSSLPAPTVCPPQYVPNEPPPVELTKNGKVKKPRRPRQPKANARPRGGSQKRKNSAPEPLINAPVASNVVQWHSQMGGPPGSSAQQCPNGPPKVRDALLKSLLQSSHPSDPPSTRCSSSSSLCSPIPDPAPIMRSSSDTQPSFAYHEHMWSTTCVADDTRSECLSCIASTSATALPQTAMYQTTMTSSQPVLTGGFMPSGIPSSASVPQMSNLYNTQMSPSACCSYTSSPAGPSGECSTYDGVHSMVASNSPMVQISCGGTEPMCNSMMQSSQAPLQPQPPMMQQQQQQQQQQWNTAQQEFLYQQQTTIYQQPVGSSGLAQMKASPLKRKTALSQTAQTAHELPSKLAHVTQTPQYTPYQQPSPQYQQPIASPQFPAQSTTPVNRLSPYGGYDGSQNGMCALNGMGQWSKRPPSRSELIRMELRHSLQARQHGASPNHSGVLSPNDLGAPRFAGVPAYTQMMSPPRMTPQSPSQLVQQQPGMTNAQQIVVPQSQPSQQNLTAAYYMPTEGAPITSLSAPNHYPTAAPSMNEPNTICITQTPVIPTELYDFNLGNGGFDMDSDATRSLVQKLLS